MAAASAMTKLDFTARLARLLPSGAQERAPEGASEADNELALRLQRAEPAAIDELYRAHHAMLRAFAQRLIGEQAAAEDLVHDVFVQVPALMRRFRGHSSLRTFLVGVAANLADRYVRGARRRRAAMARFAQEPAPAQLGHCAQVAREQLQVLYRALDALSLEQRTAFVLCEIEERSAQEAAVLLGVPEATVRTRCFHARRKLAKSFARLGLEQRP